MQKSLLLVGIGCCLVLQSAGCSQPTPTTVVTTEADKTVRHGRTSASDPVPPGVAQTPTAVLPSATPADEAKAPKRIPLPEIANPELPVPAKWRWRDARSREYPTRELIAMMEQSLPPGEPPSKPTVIVFPVVDENNSIREDGALLSLMVAYLLDPMSEIATKTSPTEFMDILREANCWRGGTVIDQQTIDLCRLASEASVIVTPVFQESTTAPGQANLRVRIRNATDETSAKTVQFPLPMNRLVEAPGLIARAIVEYLGIALEEQPLEELLTPEIRSTADLIMLADLFRKDSDVEDASYLTFLSANPGCLLAWDAYLRGTKRPDQALARLDLIDPPIQSPQLEITIAQCLHRMNRSEDGLLRLFKHSKKASHVNAYYDRLARCSLMLGDATLTKPLFDLWREKQSGYVGFLSRGRLIAEWAEHQEQDEQTTVEARESQVAQTRVRARGELEKAVEANASDWRARTQLISLAAKLDLPPDFVEKPFEAAIQLRPRNQRTYEARLDYLMQRMTQAPDALRQFAKSCVETNLWSDGIPQLVWQAAYREMFDPPTASMKYSALRSDALWNPLNDYFQALLVSSASDDERRITSKNFVVWAAFSGHYREALMEFSKQRTDFSMGEIVDPVFGSESDYAYLLDLLDAHAGFGSFQRTARAAMDVANGDWRKAEMNLTRTRVDPISPDPDRRISLIQQQIHITRRLQADRKLTFTAEELRSCLAAGSNWSGLIPLYPFHWTTQENRLTFQSKSRSLDAENVVLPLNLSRAIISGEIEWSDDIESIELIAHAYASRDRIHLMYIPNAWEVHMIRNGKILARARLGERVQTFRIEYGVDFDNLQPTDGLVWQAPVTDDVRSGFGWRVVSRPGTVNGGFTISNLTIELPEVESPVTNAADNKE